MYVFISLQFCASVPGLLAKFDDLITSKSAQKVSKNIQCFQLDRHISTLT